MIRDGSQPCVSDTRRRGYPRRISRRPNGQGWPANDIGQSEAGAEGSDASQGRRERCGEGVTSTRGGNAKGMQSFASYFLIAFLVFSSVGMSGCGEKFKKKFIRKKKTEAAVQQPILTLEPDHKAVGPAVDRYREHFAYWKSWHSDLLTYYGKLGKQDKANLNGAIGELAAMQGLLEGEPAERLKTMITQMRDIHEQWKVQPPTFVPNATTRVRLEKLKRQINSSFHYSNVKDFIIQEPHGSEEEPQAPNPT